MNAVARDAGLVRGLGTWGLAASIVSMVVGAGIFAVPGALAAAVGPYAPLAFLACGVGIGAVAICFAEGGSRMPTSGGAYGYIAASLGPLPGYVCGTLLWISDALASGGVAAAFADLVASITPQSLAGVVRPIATIGLVGTIALVNVRGIRRGAQLMGAATAVKLIPLAVFVLVGATVVHGSNLTLHPTSVSAGAGRAIFLALFALIGMEGSLCASGEVAQPARTIPRAIALALIAVTLLYLSIQVVAQGILGAALATSTSPLADAMGRVSPLLRALMLAGAGLSMLGWMAGDILSSPRMLFAFGRDGFLPRVLGRVHPRSRAPHVAILSYAALVLILALTGTFAELAVLATLTMAPLYILGCFAAWRLARAGVALAGAPLDFRGLGIAAAVGIGGMLAVVALASRMEILGLLVLIGVSTAVYLVQTRFAPAAAAVFIGAVSLCALPHTAAAQGGSVPDVSASFTAFWAAAQGKPFDRQEALWDRYIEGPRESLYRSVVWEVRDNPDWRAGKTKMLRFQLARYPAIAAGIPAEIGEIRSQLRTESVGFRQLFPGASGVPHAVIVLAPDFDAKSGVMPDGTPVLALAADSLLLERANLKIVLPHELFHLYDAQHAGVKNDGVMPDTGLTLPLFAEGLATYVSTVASPGYSDGQYLLQSDLGSLPRARLRTAARDFLQVADSLTIDPKAHADSPLFMRWFESDRKPLNAGYPNRAGYWLGLNLIRRLRRTYSLQQLASWSPAQAQRKTRAALMAMAQ